MLQQDHERKTIKQRRYSYTQDYLKILLPQIFCNSLTSLIIYQKQSWFQFKTHLQPEEEPHPCTKLPKTSKLQLNPKIACYIILFMFQRFPSKSSLKQNYLCQLLKSEPPETLHYQLIASVLQLEAPTIIFFFSGVTVQFSIKEKHSNHKTDWYER